VISVRETKTDEDLERAGRETALVGRRVLEHDDLALLEGQASLLREEQVGALDNVLGVRLPSASRRPATLKMLTTSGRPPQGTKRSTL